MTPQIGFIGVGQMGSRMAQNLRRKRFDVKVYDTDATAIPPDLKDVACNDIPQIAKGSGHLILMLPDDKAVLKVLKEVIKANKTQRRELTVLDSSTISHGGSLKIHELASRNGIAYIDAPVSGGSQELPNHDVADILNAMGSTIIPCGGPSLGHLAKICNNLILGITMIGVSEAFAIATRGGLAATKFKDIVNSSSGESWVTQKYLPVPGISESPVPADRQYNGGFAVRLIAKDLSLAEKAAKAAGLSSNKLNRLASRIYHEIGATSPSKDFSVIFQEIIQSK